MSLGSACSPHHVLTAGTSLVTNAAQPTRLYIGFEGVEVRFSEEQGFETNEVITPARSVRTSP